MKIQRLIGILSILLRRDKVTMPYLAETFEVSRRTIQRDIDTLCQAGIPLATSQGAGGGVSIMKNFRVDRALLTREDTQAILAGLQSLNSVSGTNGYGPLMEKLKGDGLWEEGPFLLDLASWYRGPLSQKLGLLQQAIAEGRQVLFHYYAPSGESARRVEPSRLVFQWGAWYLWGFCTGREDFRLFKLNRMAGLSLGGLFTPRPSPRPDLSDSRVFPTRYTVRALVPARYKWRLVEEYGEGCFTVEPDGRCLFTIGFTHLDSALDWVLGFHGDAQVLEPEELRARLLAVAEKIARGGEA